MRLLLSFSAYAELRKHTVKIIQVLNLTPLFFSRPGEVKTNTLHNFYAPQPERLLQRSPKTRFPGTRAPKPPYFTLSVAVKQPNATLRTKRHFHHKSRNILYRNETSTTIKEGEEMYNPVNDNLILTLAAIGEQRMYRNIKQSITNK